MEFLGAIGDRQVIYTNARTDPKWSENLPTDNWIVFTIADEDERLLREVVGLCLDKSVSYICCAGRACRLTEDLFDGDIVYRAVEFELQTGGASDCSNSPSTTSHPNFSEGFWFATFLARDDEKDPNTVICVDLTSSGVKSHLVDLINKINNGWLPSDDKFEAPVYD